MCATLLDKRERKEAIFHDPAIVRECIKTLRNSGDLHEIGTAWGWLELTYGYKAAMEILHEHDADQMALAVCGYEEALQ